MKEVKRTILSKKDERDDAGQSNLNVEPPKLLLKTKAKPGINVAQSQPTISIASRDPNTSAILASKPSAANNPSIASSVSSANAKDVPDVGQEAQSAPAAASAEPPQVKVKSMAAPLPLINDHYQLDPAALSYLAEPNDNFFVVGAIGTQGTGKSTLLNILNSKRALSKMSSPEEAFCSVTPFETKRTVENTSTIPTSEGIRMFITGDRTFLLDCSPVLCNPYKKDVVLNEIDDLKMIIFMLSVCQTILVVEDDPINMNLLRLISCAEMMRPNPVRDEASKTSSSNNPSEHHPRILFVHNLAEQRHFLPSARERLDTVYKLCLKHSRLRMFTGNQQFDQPTLPKHESTEIEDPNDPSDTPTRRPDEKPLVLNTFTMPKVQQSKYFI